MLVLMEKFFLQKTQNQLTVALLAKTYPAKQPLYSSARRRTHAPALEPSAPFASLGQLTVRASSKLTTNYATKANPCRCIRQCGDKKSTSVVSSKATAPFRCS